MKKLLWFVVLIMPAFTLEAQGNSAYVEKTLQEVLRNRIPVFDTNFQQINNRTMVFAQFDTCVNDMWTRPQFIDNVLHSAFDGGAIRKTVTLDTITNRKNTHYLEFKKEDRDNEGNITGNTIVFLIDRSIKPQKPVFKIPAALITSGHSYWQNESIEMNGKSIVLDSCHQVYRLRFKPDLTFQRDFHSKSPACYTAAMEHEVDTDVQAENAFTYGYKLQGHTIENPRGHWWIENDLLLLENKYRLKTDAYKIVKLTPTELIMEMEEYHFLIQFKKVDGH